MAEITALSIARDLSHGEQRRVLFRALIDNGDIHEVEGYYATTSAAENALVTWGAELLSRCALAECRRLVRRCPTVPTLRYATKAVMRGVLREAYRTLTGMELARLAEALYRWYQAGYVTVADVDAMFGTTAATRPALLARIQAKRDAWLAVRDAAGE